jgi:hypothetical protein
MSYIRSRVKSKTAIIDKVAPPSEPPATAVCALESCGRRFEVGKRLNQYRHSGTAHVSTARYCCAAHRVAAYRIRRTIEAGIPHSQRNSQRNKNAPKQSVATTLHATVTTPEIREENQDAVGVEKTTFGPSQDARQSDRHLVDTTDEAKAVITRAVADGCGDRGGLWTEERGKRVSALLERRGMYRVRLPDGRLSELLNRARARDLHRTLTERVDAS